jgi:alkylation response protein AidB-like acyl-CoA dehydrogenase
MNELFDLTDAQRMVRDLARKIARERVTPNATRYDEAEGA